MTSPNPIATTTRRSGATSRTEVGIRHGEGLCVEVADRSHPVGHALGEGDAEGDDDGEAEAVGEGVAEGVGETVGEGVADAPGRGKGSAAQADEVGDTENNTDASPEEPSSANGLPYRPGEPADEPRTDLTTGVPTLRGVRRPAQSR